LGGWPVKGAPRTSDSEAGGRAGQDPPSPLDYSQVDMRGAAYEAVLLYCECAATKKIGLPEGEKVAIHIIDLHPALLMKKSIANFYE